MVNQRHDPAPEHSCKPKGWGILHVQKCQSSNGKYDAHIADSPLVGKGKLIEE